VTLAALVFLMSGTNGLFTTKVTLVAYFDNAEGLRAGQPQMLDPAADVTVTPWRRA